MTQSLSDIIIHIVFSTKERTPWIQADVENELYQYISGVCYRLDSPVIQINGVRDHIHILLQLDKTMCLSQIISEMKSSSSRWIKTKGTHYQHFTWQSGYGAFSVSRPNVDGVKKYISSQKEHHKTSTFKEEFLTMLRRAQIPYDEKYLWD